MTNLPECIAADIPGSRDAADVGMASLLMGGVLFLAAPMTVMVAVLVWRFADDSPTIVLMHAWLARGGVLIGSLLGIAGITFGLWGFRLAKRRHQCTGMELAGLLLGVLASMAWSVASIGLLNTTESLLRLHGR